MMEGQDQGCVGRAVDDREHVWSEVTRAGVRIGGGQGFYGDGHEPVADLLADGVDYLVCEALAELTLAILQKDRQRDESLFVGPLAHELAWEWDDWDRIAAGVVVGHVLECSGQITGGNYSGAWWENPDPTRIAFPIAEVEADGTAVLTKPAGTGGMLTFDTVREQVLYAGHDPARYLNPYVTADFTSLRLADLVP